MGTEKICGLVILYHPTEEEINNIQFFIKRLKKLWIIDNSESDLRDYSRFFGGADNIVIVQDGFNRGIGARINFVLQKALEEGFTWLLTMDQDSTFTDLNLTKYFDKISSLGDNNDIAMVGVGYGTHAADNGKDIFFTPVDSVITSGTIINIKAAKKIGMLNEDLFIDEVDTEFSYRALVGGWQVLQCEGVFMNHKLGEMKLVRSLFTFKQSARSLHAPVRLYYITRNFQWVKQRYEKYFPLVFKLRSKQIMTVYKNNIIYNPKRIEVIKMIMKGYRDYKNNKFGKIS